MSTPPTHLLWLDLETNGSADDSAILEVGVVLTDASPYLVPVESWTSPILPADLDWYTRMEPGARRLHEANGLLDDILAGRGVPLDEADTAIRALIDRHSPRRRVPMAGSGVAHFDRKFVLRDMPKTAKRLTYFSIDVGSVRRMCQMVNVRLPEPPKKTHRAFDCVANEIDEGVRYLRLLSAGSCDDDCASNAASAAHSDATYNLTSDPWHR